jgi:hypothetical protein
MDLFGIPIVIGLASVAIAGIVALTRPFETWRQVAIRLLVLGAILVIGTALLRALVNR